MFGLMHPIAPDGTPDGDPTYLGENFSRSFCPSIADLSASQKYDTASHRIHAVVMEGDEAVNEVLDAHGAASGELSGGGAWNSMLVSARMACIRNVERISWLEFQWLMTAISSTESRLHYQTEGSSGWGLTN